MVPATRWVAPPSRWPAFLNFGYEVGDTKNNAAVGDQPVLHRGGGDQVLPEGASACTFAQSDETPEYNKKCKAAIVGNGTISNAFGAATDPTAKAGCDVKLTLINISDGPGVTKKRGGMTIRIDTDPPACPLAIHGALAAPIFDVKIEGVPSSELRFQVPDNLVHPAPGRGQLGHRRGVAGPAGRRARSRSTART